MGLVWFSDSKCLDISFFLQHGDKDTQMEVLLDNHRYKTLVDNFPTLRSAVIEFMSKAMKEVMMAHSKLAFKFFFNFFWPLLNFALCIVSYRVVVQQGDLVLGFPW